MQAGYKRATPVSNPAMDEPVRASVRFPLQLPVELHTEEATVDATTVDVSSTGMLFVSDSVLPVGTEVDWELILPADAMGTGADIGVLCHGRVVWVQQDRRPNRMAVMIDQYRIKENAS